MRKKPKTQKTPQDQEIPIPKRKDVMNDLLKVAKSGKDSSPKSGPKKK